LASKPLFHVFRFGPQNRQLWFGDLAHKITATVFWFVPQNQVGYGLLVASSRRSRGNEVEDEWVDVMGCIRLFYPNFAIFVVLSLEDSSVISFPINRTQGLVEREAFNHLSPTL
jgi:hypothetical protein